MQKDRLLTDIDGETAHVSVLFLVQGFVCVVLAIVLDEGEAILKEGEQSRSANLEDRSGGSGIAGRGTPTPRSGRSNIDGKQRKWNNFGIARSFLEKSGDLGGLYWL